MARVPRDRNDKSELDRVRARFVTSINRVTEHPLTKEGCLVVIYGPELGRKYSLERPSVTLGRSNKCDIQVDQESVSRAHSKIVNSGRSVRIRDLGSINGTYVNDELVEERTLCDGDFLKIGRTIFKFLSGGNIERAYHEEIYRLSTVDGLTQTFNKRFFLQRLKEGIARSTLDSRATSPVTRLSRAGTRPPTPRTGTGGASSTGGARASGGTGIGAHRAGSIVDPESPAESS